MADNADRNLPASAKKIRKARQEGNVPRSRVLGHFVAMGLAAALLFTVMPQLTSYSQRLLADGLTFDHSVVANPQIAGEHALVEALDGGQSRTVAENDVQELQSLDVAAENDEAQRQGRREDQADRAP